MPALGMYWTCLSSVGSSRKRPWSRVPRILSLPETPCSGAAIAQLVVCWARCPDRLIGLVVRRPPRERKIPGSNPACAGIFSVSSHTSDLKIGTPVATLPGAWCNRVSAETGWPGVSILRLGEVESLICNFYLSVAVRKIV